MNDPQIFLRSPSQVLDAAGMPANQPTALGSAAQPSPPSLQEQILRMSTEFTNVVSQVNEVNGAIGDRIGRLEFVLQKVIEHVGFDINKLIEESKNENKREENLNATSGFKENGSTKESSN